MSPLVSVIIPVFNGERYVQQALESALGQTHPRMEIIVTNDGSTDDTLTTLAKYAHAVTIITQRNSGIAAARNRGVAMASGDFVAFLDHDDLWAPTKVSEQVALFQANPIYAFTHTGRKVIDSAGAEVQIAHVPPLQGDCLRALIEHNVVTLSSAMVPRTRLGPAPFRQGMFGCEDWDLWLRLAATGPVGHLDRPLTYYRLHDGNYSKRTEAMSVGMVAVLGHFIDSSHGELRTAAMRHQHRIKLDLAHMAFERGDYQEAKRRFQAAGPPWSSPDTRRRFLCSLPAPVRDAARKVARVFGSE